MATRKMITHINIKRVAIALIIVYIILGFVFYGLGSLIGLIFRPRHKSTAQTQSVIQVDASAIVTTPPPEDILKVCIDAGHGGKDGGSVSNIATRYEKDDNLAIALAVQAELKKQGVEVVMTRDDDTFVSLPKRCEIANKADVDYFVALHRNTSEEGSGVEIWVRKTKPAEDTRLATNILNGITNVGVQKNRGVHFGYVDQPDSDYQVNRETTMPSCLVEMGFMNDLEDNRLFDENLQQYALAIADGIILTWQEYKSSSETTTTPAVSEQYTTSNSIITNIDN